MPTKRELVLDAAIELLGSRGLRALTHRGVDDTAGVPAGSTSNYFRTREALLAGIAERLEQLDHSDWERLGHVPLPSTIEELVTGMANVLSHAIGPGRTRTLARYALFLEAQQMPALQESVRRGHERLTAWAASLLGNFDASPEVAKLLVDYFDGAVLHQLTSPAPDFAPHATVDRMVRALLTPRR